MNLNTTLTDGVTSRYTLVIGGKSYQFGPDNAQVTADRTTFTFNPLTGGIYTVTYAGRRRARRQRGAVADHPHAVLHRGGRTGRLVTTSTCSTLPAT